MILNVAARPKPTPTGRGATRRRSVVFAVRSDPRARGPRGNLAAKELPAGTHTGTLRRVDALVAVAECFLAGQSEAADTTPLDRSTSLIKGEGKILVMDDEPSIRALVHQMLGFLGYEVHCVADGQEAIQQYEEALNSSKPFSAVILDLTVPGRMGGKETLSRLKQLDPGVRAIVASGYSNEMSLSQYSTYGFLGAVSKPFHFSDLSQLLSQITQETESSLPLRSTA